MKDILDAKVQEAVLMLIAYVMGMITVEMAVMKRTVEVVLANSYSCVASYVTM